ncbi:myosin heavy chain, non-muscle-like [Lolium rigidum]|uniref:myosin heavy chain, non-muscle-like n=1 Tax=Lolium rigidum TaxID=89674 RepID=UPI001F5CCF68|nr:myosin heavy chain, non-muscle-like [Lolium rigidum]
MASQDGGWGDGGDSLFEGMVLFAPSLSAAAEAPEPPKPPTPRPAAAAADADADTSAASQPLDEDLFSDLTLLAPQPPLDQDQQPQAQDQSHRPASPVSPAPAAALSRQPSSSALRKKKRAVRIGYGRSPQSAPALPPTAAPATTTTTTTAAAVIPTASSSGSLPVPDALPHDAAPPIPSQYPDHHQADNGHEDPEVSSSDVKQEAKEEDVGEKEVAGGAGAAAVGIEERLALLRSRMSGKLDAIQQRAAAVAAKRRQLAGRQRKVAEDVASAASKHKDLERELEEACEAEDFERAERISDSLAALETDKDRLLTALRDAELVYDSVDLELQDVLESRIAMEEEAAALLEQFAKDATDHADSVSKQAEEMSSKEIEEWQTSMEILQIKKLEMEVETELVLSARSGLEGSVEHLIEDDKREKDMLSKKGDTLTVELAELLELVRLKEAEIAENNARIQEVQERISAVVSRFHGSQSDIDLKINSLQEAQNKIDQDTEALVLKKNEIDNFVSSTEQKDSDLREIINACSSEAKACQQSVEIRRKLASSILKSRQDRIGLLKREEEISQDIQMLRQQTTDARTSLQGISSRRAGIQQEIATFKQKLSFMDKRGPELEAEKKVAAAARNFKEAGRIAAEAKALYSEKEELHAKLEKAGTDLEIIEKDITATTDKIQECEGLIVLKEQESAMTSYKRLRLDSSAARAELTAATETDDKEEVEILRKEAEAAESKALELKTMYNLQPDGDEYTFQPVVPIAFITNSTWQQLAEMASSFGLSPEE